MEAEAAAADAILARDTAMRGKASAEAMAMEAQMSRDAAVRQRAEATETARKEVAAEHAVKRLRDAAIKKRMNEDRAVMGGLGAPPPMGSNQRLGSPGDAMDSGQGMAAAGMMAAKAKRGRRQHKDGDHADPGPQRQGSKGDLPDAGGRRRRSSPVDEKISEAGL